IWGKAKCLKSFLMLDLALHLAKGWEYRGRRVKQGVVIYFAFEGTWGFGKRVEAQRVHYSLATDEKIPLYVVPGRASLIEDEQAMIGELEAQREGAAPVLIVFDTLNKSLNGSENDENMARYHRAAGVIQEKFQCLVAIIHHCGYDTSRPRGHSSQQGA